MLLLMGEKYQALENHLRKITAINMAQALMEWDQQVNMPRGGITGRAAQFEALSALAHEMFTSEATAAMLDAAEAEVSDQSYDSDAASMVRVVKQDYAEKTKLPIDFVAENARVIAEAHEVWAKARAEQNYSVFAPWLERLVELAKRGAAYLGYTDHPYDALLDQYERGMTAARVKSIFDAHKPQLVELIAAIGAVSDRVNDAVLKLDYDPEKQRTFGLWATEAIGFDFTRGRQDVSVHPFCTHFAKGDVRITTRFDRNYLNTALFGMLHEGGHGMYEQGISDALDGTPLGNGTSLAVHESQSRMWENIVGRSKGFWTWALPKLKETFPEQVGGVSLDNFYKAINRVERQFIRVEADEATYNLHIMLRFEIEMGLIDGAISVRELPQVWNAKFEEYLGIVPPNDAVGVLQDVHWSAGLMGYFPTYALGNLLSVQYYNKALEAHPSIPEEITRGKFDTLLTWLNENIHVHGRKFTSEELTQRITGESINPAPYITYLQQKYGDIYGL